MVALTLLFALLCIALGALLISIGLRRRRARKAARSGDGSESLVLSVGTDTGKSKQSAFDSNASDGGGDGGGD